jgi:hypothetical protein
MTMYTVKNLGDIPVLSRDVWLVTSRLGTGMSLSFFLLCRHIFQQVFIGLGHELNLFVEDLKKHTNAFCTSAHDGFQSYLLSFCGEN